jgi:hypothetical protein
MVLSATYCSEVIQLIIITISNLFSFFQFNFSFFSSINQLLSFFPEENEEIRVLTIFCLAVLVKMPEFRNILLDPFQNRLNV